MEATPFLRIVFIIPNSEELSVAEQPKIENKNKDLHTAVWLPTGASLLIILFVPEHHHHGSDRYDGL